MRGLGRRKIMPQAAPDRLHPACSPKQHGHMQELIHLRAARNGHLYFFKHTLLFSNFGKWA